MCVTIQLLVDGRPVANFRYSYTKAELTAISTSSRPATMSFGLLVTALMLSYKLPHIDDSTKVSLESITPRPHRADLISAHCFAHHIAQIVHNVREAQKPGDVEVD